MSSKPVYDVIVIGAGPAGCTTALAHARKGARVLLLEANPDAANRLAGEWLHPGAIDVLDSLHIDLRAESNFDSGRGFAVFPEDGSDPIRLPYTSDTTSDTSKDESRNARGWSGEHRALVDLLREHASSHPDVTYLDDARVVGIVGQCVSFRRTRNGAATEVFAERIVGADGRSSRARIALDLKKATTTVSRMAGLRLSESELPFEGNGHIFLGGPGPILAYRIQPDQVRLCIDVPSTLANDPATLWDAYSPILPESMRPSLRRELRSDRILWAANQVRSRADYGRPGLCLIGDAIGFGHPLTAAGITLALGDAAALVEEERFHEWRQARRRDTRVAEMLAGVLYEVFAEDTDTTVAMRQGVYRLWRRNPVERIRTMRYLSGEPKQTAAFARTFGRVTLPALSRLAGSAVLSGEKDRALAAISEIGARARWLATGRARSNTSLQTKAPALSRPAPRTSSASESAQFAIERAVDRLVTLQHEPENRPNHSDKGRSEQGGWEGEVAWCPMLAAQYVLFSHVMGIEITSDRRVGLLRHFEQTQLESGLWGLHPLSPPYLFVTALVYVASRMLGVDSESPLLARSGVFIREEGIVEIPSWGKFWLAIVGLYDWRGVASVVPELWSIPQNLPFHPSNFYCHTRHIYLAMSVIYARKLQIPSSPLLSQIRDELYAGTFQEVDWVSARRSLRKAELVTPPSLPLRVLYECAALFERYHHPDLRRRVLVDLEERIRWELGATDHTSLSPVSGLLNILALWAGNAHDPEIKLAIERLEAWVWDDEQDGTRLAGARSASWDSAFALQALTAAAPHCDVGQAVDHGAAFLRSQQIQTERVGYDEAFRLDPNGGWCFANAWHGWPVSDCTAEAMEALLTAPKDPADVEMHRDGIRFLLQCQNRDGGFGSYEARRSRLGLEWLNPAEMFGDSMTEHSYVECTGSCIAALTRSMRHFPELAKDDVRTAMDRAVVRLRALQRSDGAWQGVWAVHLIYGTLFGIRGLVASGAPPSDPALRRARRWLVERQREDGGWGESHEGCKRGEYTENRESQVIHTAWALMALLEAQEPDWQCIERGARFLIDRQESNGSWARQDPAGLFFRTALLEYDLYRQIFPLWALSSYETRRKNRLE
jgi:lanosterol synthase